MEHLLFKAAVVAADAGEFTAVISTASVDRDGDIVDPGALVAALRAWEKTGKLIPLAWNHSTAAEDIIGHVDPATARADGPRVIVDGWIDQTVDPAGKNAWRLVKSGTLGFSYGFLVPDGGATKRPGAHRGVLITELDVFEITATPVPANNETRVVAFKAITAAGMADRMRAIAADLEAGRQDAAAAATALRAMADDIAGMMDGKTVEPDREGQNPADRGRRTDRLREQAESVELEFKSDGLSRRRARPAVPAVPADDPEDRDAAADMDAGGQDATTAAATLRAIADDIAGLMATKTAEPAEPDRTLPEEKTPAGDVIRKEPDERARRVDQLREQAERVELEFKSDGLSLRKPPRTVNRPQPQPELALRDLKQRMRDEILTHLTGDIQ